MLKPADRLKELEIEGALALGALLDEVPALKRRPVETGAPFADRRADFVIRVECRERRHLLVCEVKSSGQPRDVRAALHQLRNYVAHLGADATPVFIAPYLSPEARAICREDGAGYLDLYGNARIVFDGIFIERTVAGSPPAERRALKSLFKPKSAQVLRVLLRDPDRAWRVSELAETAHVSLGHVSNVRAALIGRDWARASEEGVRLSAPGALLDAWREEYEPPAGKRLGFYTTLHGSALDDAVRPALRAGGESGRAILASFSAAQWFAPYGRTGSQYFYADDTGLERLKSRLKLSPVSKGENVVVKILTDDGLFRDALEPAPGLFCTGLVQTYLDLAAAGERGLEAAEHLRRERLAWRQ